MPRKTALWATVVLLSRRLAGDERGATAIEYAIIAAGIGAAVAATVYSLGDPTKALYEKVVAALATLQ